MLFINVNKEWSRNNKTLIHAKLRAYRQSRLMSLNIHHLNTMYHYVPAISKFTFYFVTKQTLGFSSLGIFFYQESWNKMHWNNNKNLRYLPWIEYTCIFIQRIFLASDETQLMASLAIDHRHHCWNPTLYTYFIAIPRITEKQSTCFFPCVYKRISFDIWPFRKKQQYGSKKTH